MYRCSDDMFLGSPTTVLKQSETISLLAYSTPPFLFTTQSELLLSPPTYLQPAQTIAPLVPLPSRCPHPRVKHWTILTITPHLLPCHQPTTAPANNIQSLHPPLRLRQSRCQTQQAHRPLVHTTTTNSTVPRLAPPYRQHRSNSSYNSPILQQPLPNHLPPLPVHILSSPPS